MISTLFQAENHPELGACADKLMKAVTSTLTMVKVRQRAFFFS
jgi:hypothetical protein